MRYRRPTSRLLVGQAYAVCKIRFVGLSILAFQQMLLVDVHVSRKVNKINRSGRKFSCKRTLRHGWGWYTSPQNKNYN